MKLFYDCEFLDTGRTLKFISIGMVREDGKEFYAVNRQCDWNYVADNPWLMDNVMTSIEHNFDDGYLKVTDPAGMYKGWIKQQVKEFVLSTPAPSLWAWYGAYDHVIVSQLFGRMIDLPAGFPMYTNDIKTLHELAGFPELPQQIDGLHNALADAKHNKVRYDYLKELLK